MKKLIEALKSCKNCQGDCGGGKHWNQVCIPNDFTNYELKEELQDEINQIKEHLELR